VIVRFSENPLTLRGWTTIDSRGQQVSVALTNMQTGMQLADSLFSNDSGR
jgi:outer membrane lipoprotein-sorting protein